MHHSTWFKDVLLLTLLTSLLFGMFLGLPNLSAPDELRYSEIPREMIVNQDYIIPTINGVKYFEKPPLFYWMQVASIKVFGLNEWSLRSATALMGLIGVIATYLFGRRIYNRKTGWFAGIILSSMSLYFAMAHVITLDMTVSVFMTIGLYAFFLAIKSKSFTLLCLGFFSAAAAMMTKGLIGIMLPGLIIALWLTFFRQWHRLNWRHMIIGLGLFLVLVTPWHAVAQLRAPEFLHFYFIEQQFLRYTTSIANRYQPCYFYIPIVIFGTVPWMFFLPQSLMFLKNFSWRHRWHYEHELFLVIWFVCIFLFFSASNSKLIPYVLPCFPPLALLIARHLAAKKEQFTKKFAYIYMATAAVLIAAVISVNYFDSHTIKSLIFKIKPKITSQDEIVAYHGYHQDLPFYLQRIITVNESYDELDFGTSHGNTSAWMVHEHEFKKRWLSQRTLYVFISKRKYAQFVTMYPKHPGTIVASEKNNLVITNH